MQKEGDMIKAIEDIDHALELDPYNASAYNAKAWWLATHPDSNVRNGKIAVILARRAVKLLPDRRYVDTLAAAYAEIGNYTKATEMQKEIISSLEALGTEKPTIKHYKKPLEFYKTNKPFRDE